jgi:hypothetical protein
MLHKNDDPAFFPLEEKVNFIIKLGKQNGSIYRQQELLRRQYLATSGTAFAVFKCMDGRIHLPTITNMMMGIIKPFRSMGGKFNLGWPFLTEKLTNWVLRNIDGGKKCLLIVTYHFSKGDSHRGCAGFNYDTEAAFQSTIVLRDEINYLFGKNNHAVFPVIIGIETDEDALIVHGENPEKKLDFSSLDPAAETPSILEKIKELFPKMDHKVASDFTSLIGGNLKHVEKIKKTGRELEDIRHREFMIGFGRSFDWFHRPNTALIIGPYDLDISKHLITAASLIEKNISDGMISQDGWILSTCTGHDGSGIKRRMAKLKSYQQAVFAERVIREKFSDSFFKKMKTIRIVVDERNRRLETFQDLGFHKLDN